MGMGGVNTTETKKWQFASLEELVDYVARMFDIEPLSKQSIRGTGSQVRARGRMEASASNPELFHNPVLDYITSPNGEIIVGSQSFNIRARRLGEFRRGTATFGSLTTIFTAANALMCYEDFSGLEICQSDDGRTRTYTDGIASMSFESYRDEPGFWPPFYWEMGTRIKRSGLNFEAAIINSRYYGEAYGQTCAIQKYGEDSDTNDNDLEEYEWGINSPQPTRVQSLCRVQWNDRRISGVVSAGSECFVVGTVNPWPEGYPEDWPPLNEPPQPVGTIQVRPRFLEFSARTSRPSVTKSFSLTNTFPNSVVVAVGEAQTMDTSPSDTMGLESVGGASIGEFSNDSGQLTLQPNSSMSINVTFTSGGAPGSVTGRLRVAWETGVALNRVDITLLGTFAQEAVP